MQVSKANQRRIELARLYKEKNNKHEENNILKDIKKNPYLEDKYSYLTA
jgi:hypothetical protein